MYYLTALARVSTATFAEGFENNTGQQQQQQHHQAPAVQSCGLGGSDASIIETSSAGPTSGGAPHKTWQRTHLALESIVKKSRRPHFLQRNRLHAGQVPRGTRLMCYPRCGDAGIVNLPRGTSSCEQRGTSLTASRLAALHNRDRSLA